MTSCCQEITSLPKKLAALPGRNPRKSMLTSILLTNRFRFTSKVQIVVTFCDPHILFPRVAVIHPHIIVCYLAQFVTSLLVIILSFHWNLLLVNWRI